MYTQSFTVTEDGIHGLIDQTISTAAAKGIEVIECSNLVQEKPNVIILNPDEFFRVLEILSPKCVFLYRGRFDAWDEVRAEFSDDPEEEDNEERNLYEKFVELKRDLIEQTIQVCRDVFYFEMFVLSEGHVLSCGYISSAYQSLVDEINTFREKADEEEESIKSIENEQKNAEYARIEQELMEDTAFRAIRGKRKRCVYVLNKYGDSLFNGGSLRRPDVRSEVMDSGLVSLVDRVSDALDVESYGLR